MNQTINANEQAFSIRGNNFLTEWYNVSKSKRCKRLSVKSRKKSTSFIWEYCMSGAILGTMGIIKTYIFFFSISKSTLRCILLFSFFYNPSSVMRLGMIFCGMHKTQYIAPTQNGIKIDRECIYARSRRRHTTRDQYTLTPEAPLFLPQLDAGERGRGWERKC
jgi:hypothetical protein